MNKDVLGALEGLCAVGVEESVCAPYESAARNGWASVMLHCAALCC